MIAGLTEPTSGTVRVSGRDPFSEFVHHCTPSPFTASAEALQPPKSNWARALTKPPFLAYPLIGAVAYTFGGLATSAKAEVLGERGPIAGLYAAGETTGHFYRSAPNAVAVLRALVFGKIAGREAVAFVAHGK